MEIKQYSGQSWWQHGDYVEKRPEERPGEASTADETILLIQIRQEEIRSPRGIF